MDNQISIIVPIFNCSSFLRQCMDSLVNQTYQNIQIICVNDGSTDDSLNIINEYARNDNRILVYTQINMGLSESRNRGVQLSSGDYIMFVDSDDYLDLNTCEIALNKAIETNASIVQFSYIKEFAGFSKIVHSYNNDFSCHVDRTFIRKLFGPIGDELKYPEKVDLPISAWGKLYKKELVVDTKFVSTKYVGTEDLLFQILTFNKCDYFSYIDLPLYHYRRSVLGTLTTKYMPDKFEKWINMYNLLFAIIKRGNYEKEFEIALYNRIAVSLIGIGLNETYSGAKFSVKAKRIKSILNDDLYAKALKDLKIKIMPIQWKVFFTFLKLRYSFLIVLFLSVIEYLRTRNLWFAKKLS